MVDEVEYRPWGNCTICAAPAEVIRDYTMVAYTVAGEEVVAFVRVMCAAGHQYDEEVVK